MQRTGQKIIPIPDWGIKVTSTATAAGGWWDNFGAITCCWAAYQPKGATSLAASYVDLTGAGHNCGPGVAPGWDAVNGWVFNGLTHWLSTSFIPQTDQTQSMLAQYTGVPAVAANACMVGVRTGGGDYGLWPNYVGGVANYSNGGSASVAPGLLAGNIGVAGNRGYRNGVAEGGALAVWGAGGAYAVYIGCWNQIGVPARFQVCNVQALALYDCSLTPAEVAVVRANMAAL